MSIFAHAAVFLVLIYGGFILPSSVIQIGSGAGGGTGGDVSTVGVVDDLSGGMGMIKPSLVPKPAALLEETPREQSKAIPLPQTVEPKKNKPDKKDANAPAKILPKSNIIPVAPEPGSGGYRRTQWRQRRRNWRRQRDLHRIGLRRIWRFLVRPRCGIPDQRQLDPSLRRRARRNDL